MNTPRLRRLLEQAGVVAPPPARYRSFTPRPPAPEPPGRSLPFGPIITAAEYGTEFELWHANKLTLIVDNFAVLVQLSRSLPPHPPEWDAPFVVPIGPYSHVGPFGYFRFKDATAGQNASVTGTAFSE